jgi:DNA-binding transcriptional LysR family regulator
MNTDTLYTFVQLAKYKNFTQTAGKLYVAQSTVTNRIFELEEELGQKLFLRNKKQLSLTPEGEHFLEYAMRILELEAQAMKEIGALNHFKHSLRIGTTNTIYDCYLEENSVDFIQKHPDIKLNITISHSHPLIQMLYDKTIDMAFTYIPCHKKEIACHILSTESLVLVTGRYNDTYINGITQAQLAAIPYYYCDFNIQDMGSYIKDLFPKGHSFPLEIDRSANLLPYLSSGCGYSFLPQSLIQEEITAGTLITIPLLDFTIPEVISYVITREENRETICVREYLESFKGKISEVISVPSPG